jgi:chemotaxis signal transduction protein
MEIVEKKDEMKLTGVKEFLPVRLRREEYGCDILKVQEIRGYENPTRIANAPEFADALDVSYVMGLAAIGERMLILVDIEKLMTSEEMQLIERVEKSTLI